MTTAPTLTEFLLARIAEDDAVAREVDQGRHEIATGSEAEAHRACSCYGEVVYTVSASRVLAECEAKRRIIRGSIPARIVRPDGKVLSLMEPNELANSDALHKWIVHVLATIYADHPDYRAEWEV